MNILKWVIQRLFMRRAFFYSWEERAFERRREQYYTDIQNACRLRKD